MASGKVLENLFDAGCALQCVASYDRARFHAKDRYAPVCLTAHEPSNTMPLQRLECLPMLHATPLMRMLTCNTISGWKLDISTAEMYNATTKDPADFAPGERWQYSDEGYILLGMIIDEASAQRTRKQPSKPNIREFK